MINLFVKDHLNVVRICRPRHPECRECNPLQTAKVIGVNYFSSATKSANIYSKRLKISNLTSSVTGNGDDGDSFRDKERKRKESEQYLMMNFPADVRKNLKGIILPPEKIDRKTENIEQENMNNVTENVSNDEGNLFQGQENLHFQTLKML